MELNRGEIYTCSKGSQLEILETCEVCDLQCCGEPMKKEEEKTADSATEKHVPVVEKVDGGVKVTVGSTIHPMEDDHYIQWIEIRTADDKVQKQYLKPGKDPIATFKTDSDVVTAREHCNKHGLWKA